MTFTEQVDAIKSRLTQDEIDDYVCNVLGSNGYREEAQGVRRYNTVCHGGDSYKLYYYPDGKNFMCYTHCGQIGDIFDLTQKVKGLSSFYEAYKIVCAYFGINGEIDRDVAQTELIDDWGILNKVKDYKVEEEKKCIAIPESYLEFYSATLPKEWIKDGISIEAMKKYKIRSDISAHKAIIPHYDIDGNLIGIRGRAFDPVEIAERGKYAPVQIGNTLMNHRLSLNLYGLNFVKDNVKKVGKVCIAESEKACMQSYTMFGDGNFTVASCGSGGLSWEQINLLLSCNVKEVIIAYDQECENLKDISCVKNYEAKLLKIAKPLTPFFNVYVIFDYDGLLAFKQSPFDVSKDVLIELMKKKIHIQPVAEEVAKKKRKKS